MELESLAIGLLAGVLLSQYLPKHFRLRFERVGKKEEDTEKVEFDK